MKFREDNQFEDQLELDLVFNTVPDRLESPTIGEVVPDKAYPILPVKHFDKDEIQALQDKLDARGNK